jgi:hypothetical protein
MFGLRREENTTLYVLCGQIISMRNVASHSTNTRYRATNDTITTMAHAAIGIFNLLEMRQNIPHLQTLLVEYHVVNALQKKGIFALEIAVVSPSRPTSIESADEDLAKGHGKKRSAPVGVTGAGGVTEEETREEERASSRARMA